MWISSWTTRVSQYQKKHSATHTYSGHQSSLICFIHLIRSMASSLLNLRTWHSFAQSLSKFSLVYFLAWHPALHTYIHTTPYISSPNHCLLFATQAHTIATCFAVVPRLCHLILRSLSFNPLQAFWGKATTKYCRCGTDPKHNFDTTLHYFTCSLQIHSTYGIHAFTLLVQQCRIHCLPIFSVLAKRLVGMNISEMTGFVAKNFDSITQSINQKAAYLHNSFVRPNHFHWDPTIHQFASCKCFINNAVAVFHVLTCLLAWG